MKYTWIFYYTTTNNKCYKYGTKVCVKPRLTQMHKELDHFVALRNDINTWGYSRESIIEGRYANTLKPESIEQSFEVCGISGCPMPGNQEKMSIFTS